MQVDAFRGYIRGQQNADGAVLFAERLYDLLLFHIGQSGVEDGNGPIPGRQVALQLFLQKAQGGDAFREDDHPLAGGVGDRGADRAGAGIC